MYKYVIFDMDGVLVDSEPFHFLVLSEYFRSLGYEFTKEYHNNLIGTASGPMWEKLKTDFNLTGSKETLIKNHKALFYDMLEDNTMEPTPGIGSFLIQLADMGCNRSLASSSPKKLINIFVNQLGLNDYFDHLVSGEELERSKPFPDIFLKVSTLYDLHPSNFLVIEDSRNGTLAAKAAGMYCVGYQNPNSGNQDLSAADLIISDFSELSTDRLTQLKH